MQQQVYDCVLGLRNKDMRLDDFIKYITKIPGARMMLIVLASTTGTSTYGRAKWVAKQVEVPVAVLLMRVEIRSMWKYHYKIAAHARNRISCFSRRARTGSQGCESR